MGRNKRVNLLLGELAKGNSRLQLVNIDTGFVQVDQSISHHDMWDYLELTQKGYSKAFEPVNELLTQLISEMEGSCAGQRRKVAQIKPTFPPFLPSSAIARNTKVLAARTGAWQPERVLRDQIAASASIPNFDTALIPKSEEGPLP